MNNVGSALMIMMAGQFRNAAARAVLGAVVLLLNFGCAEDRVARGGAASAVSGPEDAAAIAHVWRVRHGALIERTWGVQVVGVHLTASDWMIEFKYRVTDPEKASGLLGHKAKPYLTDRPSGAKLAVPAMENVGELRQAADPQSGRDYFILFGNANKIVRRGNVVDVEIGAFRADGLIVE